MKKLIVAVLLAQVSQVVVGGMITQGNRVAGLPEIPITVSGTIGFPPCTINGDTLTVVDFDDIVIESIDGIRYVRDVPVTIKCPEKYNTELTLTIMGTESDFDEYAAISDVSDFAIRFSIDGKKVKLNQPNTVNWRIPIVLRAVPIKNTKGLPKAGKFKTNITLQLEIQ